MKQFNIIIKIAKIYYFAQSNYDLWKSVELYKNVGTER